ncbi:hypothetical protein ACIQPP_49555 [Streptomyces violaceusniger]|uniref:hypothetical protein n=1 Tax=Streptomyces violaceusniger TaxID=68280 RepID=UPI0009C27072|nr:hypothetical protein [Streptomyces hygroscopicus]AQW48321.1 hypothetical protein SHXM_01784 [Streptomyces hygroscopicus]
MSIAPAYAPCLAELIHDALIRGWADLRDWVAKDHQFQVWLQRATEQQARHEHSGLPGDLLDGSLLAEGEEWADQRSLPTDITSLLEASRQHQQSALRRTRRINITLVGMLVLALVATGVAFSQWQTVIGQRDRAASAQVVGVAQSVRRTDPQLGHGRRTARSRRLPRPGNGRGNERRWLTLALSVVYLADTGHVVGALALTGAGAGAPPDAAALVGPALPMRVLLGGGRTATLR